MYMSRTFNKTSDVLLRNFASSGAEGNTTTNTTKLNLPPSSSLYQQVCIEFEELHGESGVLTHAIQVNSKFLPQFSPAPAEIPWAGNNSLFSTWMGIDSLNDTYLMPDVPKANKQQIVQWTMAQEALYKAGGTHPSIFSSFGSRIELQA